MDDNERVKAYVELWKQTIVVQQHFNDIEMRIRGLALTVLTFTLGGTAVAIKDGSTVSFLCIEWRLASVVLFVGAALWLAFYFMDQVWYHKLLVGAVKHGEELEAELRKDLPKAGLTKSITASSPYEIRIGWGARGLRRELHSKGKIRIFYYSILGVMVALGLMLQFG
jgi:hypothetical protein